MANDTQDTALAIALLSEVVAADQAIKSALARYLPKGMESSHFATLNHLSNGGEKSPAQLARNFQLTKGAMTNTLQKLEALGYIHIRPDWDDARKKLVSISPAGQAARERALLAVAPVFEQVIAEVGTENIRQILPGLRDFRKAIT